jgi:hypothetical protein
MAMPAGSSWLRIQAVSGVDHQQELIGVAPAPVVDDQVVADAAGLVEQHRVAGLAGADPEQVGGHQMLQRILDAITAQGEHPHVGDVEHPAALAHGVVLSHQAAVLHGHLPARERHQAAPGRGDRTVERSAPQAAVRGGRGGGGIGHGRAWRGGEAGLRDPMEPEVRRKSVDGLGFGSAHCSAATKLITLSGQP